MSDIEIIKADITQLKVDATNNALMGGGGVDWAIHQAAGVELLNECRSLMGCETGQSKITNGYNLNAKYIIHTVGPVWNNGTEGEEVLLKSCYINSLELAIQHNIKTIAFPAISTGAYRFPFDKAVSIAYLTIKYFLTQNRAIEKVYLVYYKDIDIRQAQRILKKLVQ
jgi:O-acetyl-ADP-ribose deacetylase (regulator of RNase III)